MAVVAREHAVGKPEQRVNECLAVDRPARPEAHTRGQRLLAGADPDRHLPGRFVEIDLADAFACVGARAIVASGELGLLLRHHVGVDGGSLVRARRTRRVLLQASQAFLVLDQLPLFAVHAVKQRPPGRLVGTAVKIQQLVAQLGGVVLGQPLGAVGRQGVDQPLAVRHQALLGLLRLRQGRHLAGGAFGRCDAKSHPPRHARRPQLQKPVVQLLGRFDVVAVVDGNVLQQLRVLRFAPALVEDNAGAGILDVARARRPIEALDVLDRVARLGCADGLAHDLVQVHEGALAQQVVDLHFARGVPAGQALECRFFVAGVVVDVGAGKLFAPLGDEVDEGLERRPLIGAGMRPERQERPGSTVAEPDPEQVLQPSVLERVTLHVEEHVAGIGLRQPVKAPARLGVRRQHQHFALARVSGPVLDCQEQGDNFASLRRHRLRSDNFASQP